MIREDNFPNVILLSKLFFPHPGGSTSEASSLVSLEVLLLFHLIFFVSFMECCSHLFQFILSYVRILIGNFDL